MQTQDDDRLTELRRAAVQDPRNGQIRYLLGAELAQQRRYDEAILELSAAIALDPLLHVARFQLGLLHITMAQTQHSTAVLAPLEALPDDSALKYFKRGLDALIVDELATALACLEHGMALNTDNPPLNADMQMLAGRVRAVLDENKGAGPSDSDRDPSTVRTDFSLYGVTRH